LPDYSTGRKSGGPLTGARKTKSPQSLTTAGFDNKGVA
jgi:hypothetical protein